MLAFDLQPMPGFIDSDSALIQDCQAGSVEAFGVLVSRHRDGVYNFVRHTIGPNGDAQDIAQEAFVRAYASIHRFRDGARFEPWLYTIAANLCRSHLRQVGRRRDRTDADQNLESLAAPPNCDPAYVVERQDEHRRMLAAIQSLPADQRMVVVLRHLQERSYNQIAEILDIPVTTVEHRLRAARTVLWKQVYGEMPPRHGRGA